ncbi:hypothetical protein, partial [Pseudomonas syringae group genomosp. 7]|uniref:hypothetical protein n=1 Tax=Pseudomonas syringae group genomosp. 7 TaxID=251699 RepID=UPI00376F8397
VVSLGEGIEQALLVLAADTDAAVQNGNVHVKHLRDRTLGGLQDEPDADNNGDLDLLTKKDVQLQLVTLSVDKLIGVGRAVVGGG